MAVAVMSPTGINHAADARLSHRPAHPVTRTGHSIIPSSSAQGGASGRVRVRAMLVFHRRGRPPFGMVPATVLITRWIDEDIKPLTNTANPHATQGFSTWWRAIPAGFNRMVSLIPIAAVFLSHTTFTRAHACLSILDPQGLPLVATPSEPTATRWTSLTIASNLPRVVRLGASPRSWGFEQLLPPPNRNSI